MAIIVFKKGLKYYHNNEYRRHRIDGPAVICPDGTKFWYQNDVYHREDGPAIELSNGDKYWYYLGTHHRADGPATEMANGKCSFWYMGNFIDVNSTQEYIKYIKLHPFW